MIEFKPRRSVLYIPGSNERALEKAKSLQADSLILDLEDAVAPDAKKQARTLICQAVKSGDYGLRELVIRINSHNTQWAKADLEAAIDAEPDAILVPKVNHPKDLYKISKKIKGSKKHLKTKIWAMIETPKGLINVNKIAKSAKNKNPLLECFIMGTNDIAKETNIKFEKDRSAFIPLLINALLAARANNIYIVDGVFNNFKDSQAFEKECLQGFGLGMDGKTLIHPNQIAKCNEVFSPSENDIADAKDIIDAFEQEENMGKGAIVINGKMVELLHRDIAKKTLEISKAIAACK